MWFTANDLTAMFSGVEAGDMLGALVIGIGAGVGGRSTAWLVRWAKSQSKSENFLPRILLGGVLLALLALWADFGFDAPLTIGPGQEAMSWVFNPDHGLGLIAPLF